MLTHASDILNSSHFKRMSGSTRTMSTPEASSTPIHTKIAVFGLGYVGMSMAVLLAKHNQVVAVDLMQARVDQVNNKVSPIEDPDITQALQTEALNLVATTDGVAALQGAEYVVIATPTDYDVDTNRFNTRSVEAVIQLALQHAPDAVLVIKSTIPVGYVEDARQRLGTHPRAGAHRCAGFAGARFANPGWHAPHGPCAGPSRGVGRFGLSGAGQLGARCGEARSVPGGHCTGRRASGRGPAMPRPDLGLYRAAPPI